MKLFLKHNLIKYALFLSLTFLFQLIINACTTQECRNRQSAPPLTEAVMKKPTTPLEKVKVYKPDGSLQCGMGKATPIQDIRIELKDIEVYSSHRQHDGMMHIALCGSPTGQVYIFEINRTDLEKAKELGFRQWTME